MLFGILPNNRPFGGEPGFWRKNTTSDRQMETRIKKLFTNDEDRRKYLEEYARRVGRQEDALNKMTANDLKAAFDARWDTQGVVIRSRRGSQQQMRVQPSDRGTKSVIKVHYSDNQKPPDDEQLSRSEPNQSQSESAASCASWPFLV